MAVLFKLVEEAYNRVKESFRFNEKPRYSQTRKGARSARTERIPADGMVVEGATHADESLLSGEAMPVAKCVGDRVVSGSLNAGGVVHVRATRTGDESALAQIIRLVERALSSRTRIERTVDRVARIFVPAVVLLAIVEFAVLFEMHMSIADAMMRATLVPPQPGAATAPPLFIFPLFQNFIFASYWIARFAPCHDNYFRTLLRGSCGCYPATSQNQVTLVF